jgi:4-aminobutyrate aminotransferase/(S)-3-amino-2-methylpropionate transaminase
MSSPRVEPFERRISDERAKYRVTYEGLLERVEKEARGPENRRLMEELIKYESVGHLHWAVFRCPPVLKSGKGSTLTDVDGNTYLDFMGGFGVHNAGLCHPEIVRAIKDQAEKLTQWAEMPSEPRIALAKKITEIVPMKGPKRVQFNTTGGEAIEAGIKIARFYTGRPTILTFSGAYHGRTAGAASLTANYFMKYFNTLPIDTGIVRFPYAYCYRCAFGKSYPDCGMFCVQYIERWFESIHYGLRDPDRNSTSVAATFVEACQGHAGYIVPPIEFLQGLEKLCDKFQILFGVDEVMAGMGRTGKMFAYEHSNVYPDLVALGKGIGGGIPLSALVGIAEIMDEWGPAGHGSTYGGNHIACAAGLAMINVLQKEKIIENAAKVGEHLLGVLRDMQEEHPMLGDASGRGLFIGVEFVRNKETKEPASQETDWIQRQCVERGLLIQRGGYFGNRLNIYPPLVLSEDEADKGTQILDDLVSQAEQEFHIAK